MEEYTMNALKSLAIFAVIVSFMLLFSCSSKGTVVSGGSSAGVSTGANPADPDTQAQSDEGKDHDVRDDTPLDIGSGH
jgi:hypothetical protein